MYLVQSFNRDETTCLKQFHIPGTEKSIVMRRAKEKLGLKGVKCRVSEVDDTITLLPNCLKLTIKIKEV